MELKLTDCSIKGFGFKVNCSQEVITTTQPVTTPVTLFDVSVDFVFDNPGAKPIDSQFALKAKWFPKNGTIKGNSIDSDSIVSMSKVCHLHAGIVLYDAFLQNGTIEPTFDDYTKDEFLQDL